MPWTNSKLGVGATVSTYVRFLHPRKRFKSMFLDDYDVKLLTEIELVQQCDYPGVAGVALKCSHPHFPENLFVAPRMAKVVHAAILKASFRKEFQHLLCIPSFSWTTHWGALCKHTTAYSGSWRKWKFRSCLSSPLRRQRQRRSPHLNRQCCNCCCFWGIWSQWTGLSLIP